ncbi:hypothetical protein G7Y89_g10175 [Cudoniella acicularis]|uniref:Nephrocystin 3-like N-terminal domain-containing protein n=1 Tax=Cudoniella acicularis TaxID=354080 RepID=A0A8H4RD94_9HELO|nr:hypothetical protein G7Y89_g10175 [Cudoniella acicularis]
MDDLTKFVDTYQAQRQLYISFEKEIGKVVDKLLQSEKVDFLWQSLYKPPSGQSSQEKLTALEALKSIANLGEVALQQFELTCYPILEQQSSIQPVHLIDSPPGNINPRNSISINSIHSLIIEQFHLLRKEMRPKIDEATKIPLWVSSSDPESDHNQARSKFGSHYANSGQWFCDPYHRWLTSDIPTLWLSGSVGTGKSFLVVIEWIFNDLQHVEDDRMAFYYCSKGRESGGTPPLAVLCSFIAQLGTCIEGAIAPSIVREYETREKRSLEIDDCHDILVDLVNSNGTTVFVVDALDEYANPHVLLLHPARLQQVIEGVAKPVNFLFSAHPQVKPPPDFPNVNEVELNSGALTNYDIAAYIRTQVKERYKWKLGRRLLDGKHEVLEVRLIRVLISRAGSMFRWAKLQLEVFLGPNSLGQSQSESLDGLCSLRALSVVKLAQVAALQSLPALEESEDTFMEEQILSICSNFIVKNASELAEFAHVSVREYFERRKLGEFSSDECHTQVAVDCLGFLGNPCASVKIIKKGGRDNMPWYYTEFWPDHRVRASPVNRRSGYLSLLHTNFISKTGIEEGFGRWLEAIHDHIKFYLGNPRSKRAQFSGGSKLPHGGPRNPVFAACIWGFTEIIQALPFKHPWLLEPNESGDMPISISCLYGRPEIVRELLNKGAFVYEPAKNETALYTAVFQNYQEVAGLLLEEMKTRPEMIKNRGSFSIPLARAISVGNEAMVRLLLRYMDPILMSAPTFEGVSYLHLAVKQNNQPIVDQLIEKMSRQAPSTPDREGEMAPHHASAMGPNPIVQLLLPKTRLESMGIRDDLGYTTLHYAVKMENEKGVSLLLGNMTPEQVAIGDDTSWTPLHSAVAKRDHVGWTALHAAAAFQVGEKIVRLLLSKMIPDHMLTEDRYGRAVLDLVVKHDRLDVVQILRDYLSAHTTTSPEELPRPRKRIKIQE